MKSESIDKYYHCLKFYLNCKIELDYRKHEREHKIHLNLSSDTKDEIKAELSLYWVEVMSKKEEQEITNAQNFTYKICKRELQRILQRHYRRKLAEADVKQKAGIFMHEEEYQTRTEMYVDEFHKMKTAVYMDKLSGSDIRDIVGKYLTCRQCMIIFGLYCQFSFEQIGEQLHLKADTVQRLHRETEEILKKVLLGEND